MATRRGLIFFFFFSVIVPTLLANIGEVDDYLKEVEQEAIAHFHRTYNPNPEHVVKHINEHINRTLAELEDTRRELRGKGVPAGPCEAANPIDKCWRCNPNWEKDRKKLADCALGFAQGTVGGKMGPIYVVTDGTDADVQNPKPGTLRHAVIQKGPLWITFAHSMVIKLSQELLVSSDKTIDGRGANVHIAFGGGISIQFARNIIIHGLHIHDTVSLPGGMIRDSVDHIGQRTKSDGDGINIFGSSNIWIDHISGYACEDGLVDVIQASTGITISNSHFTDHNDVMLFGAQDTFKDDAKMQITLAFNHFGKGLVQRMPRVRYAYVHLVNNDIKWEMYAIGGSYAPTIVSQGNRYHAPNNEAAKKLTKKDYIPEQVGESRNWPWISQGDLLMNGAIFEASGDPGVTKRFPLMGPLPADQVPVLTKNSGAMDCVIGKPC